MQTAFFLPGRAGRLFCSGWLNQEPPGPQRHLLIVPPFAEEMNKSRHVLRAIADVLAERGWSVLLADLYGTGDSEGDFADATIDLWRSDIDTVIAALEPRDGIDLVGLRSGALLAADAASRHATRSLTLLHPVVEGRQQLLQWLRLRVAAGLVGGDAKEKVSDLRARLAQGESLEIAGYRVTAQLADELESLVLTELVPADVRRLNWIEFAPSEQRPLSPVAQRITDGWAASGIRVNCSQIGCDQFWATQEIAPCEALPARVATLLDGDG